MAAPRTTRAQDDAVLADHHGASPTLDDALMRAAFRRFGWDMLSDEAAVWMADEYETHDQRREAIDAANRAVRERAPDAALIRAAHERGALIVAGLRADSAFGEAR